MQWSRRGESHLRQGGPDQVRQRHRQSIRPRRRAHSWTLDDSNFIPLTFNSRPTTLKSRQVLQCLRSRRTLSAPRHPAPAQTPQRCYRLHRTIPDHWGLGALNAQDVKHRRKSRRRSIGIAGQVSSRYTSPSSSLCMSGPTSFSGCPGMLPAEAPLSRCGAHRGTPSRSWHDANGAVRKARPRGIAAAATAIASVALSHTSPGAREVVNGRRAAIERSSTSTPTTTSTHAADTRA
ncbi:uncharacterized protein J3D65DRAFT_313776 [Phyllosticta citribraziliensis]|uniref:Uncharacterized protein n=1 Tax=Phyllosticta citribraziliensis TaxID=989973 RepID=A0ABR1L8M3_9PEZI